MGSLMKSLPLLYALLWAGNGVASAAEITITGMKFGSPPAELHVGDVIVWRNDDIFRHTATARDKSFDIDLPPKSEGRMTVAQAGTIDFYCRFHPAMTGKLDVRP
ncbi:cupredoxin domain-containing protein [Rhizobium laguerreae]|uniref:cupredoxin domain-containing protein n=1 Tax=Rhizobium laguerreae TaxID=1076926 RepID=UPI001C909709|nr:cupredoxin family copper-binding protein [Rhizobium laguerreae]MBY3332834.1 cupredoxin family copper-binding protein [Rhizobium laguerreae]MBY3364987.1 cupredoxin family copper-binding protein [Rhizobium laguerreae]MBY3384190.1 cupredoxin family copper-binding protein [Rhizobium laguerreae]MBY3397851.1 cupredoxin family copper-binding protein [Rhizobium laguerreae]MBY3404791.1 cupredoxin family copper-binding protein [Rhizobium laguerreae]